MRSIKPIVLILFMLFIAAFLAGCTGKPAVTVVYQSQDEVTVTPGEAQASAAAAGDQPSVANAEVHTYEAVDSKIIRDDGEVIYDASSYGKDYDHFGISHLTDDGEALYLVEAGANLDDNDGEIKDMSIVRIDYHGGNRQVLVSQRAIGYIDFISFGDRLFFINDGFDSCSIGDVSKDGKELNVIDWEAFAARFDAPPYFLSASFTQDADYLYGQISLFEAELEGITRHVRIDKNMTLEDMPLSEDQYLVSGSKIILLSKETGEKNMIYDAADFYDEDVMISQTLETDGKLHFIENVIKPGFTEHLNSIVTLDKNSLNRKLLCSTLNNQWYTQIELYNDYVFFVEETLYSARLGYVPVTGGDVNYIELPPEYQNDDVNWLDASIDELNLHMVHRSGNTAQQYTLTIDKDLNLSVKES